MLMPFVPGALIATAALKVPGFDPNATGFTVTCKLAGKLPAPGLTVSHVPPLYVIGVALKLVTPELELDREVVTDAGAVLPGAKTKLSEFGLAENALPIPPELAFRVTGIDKALVPERTLINPTSSPEAGAPGPMDTVRSNGVDPEDGVTASQLVSE
jgi:hypothetical protein